MDNTLVMYIIDRETQLAEYDPSFVLRETALLCEVIEELSAGAQFSDKPDGRLCRDDLVQLGDMRMVQLAVVVDFTGKGCREALRDLLDGNSG